MPWSHGTEHVTVGLRREEAAWLVTTWGPLRKDRAAASLDRVRLLVV